MHQTSNSDTECTYLVVRQAEGLYRVKKVVAEENCEESGWKSAEDSVLGERGAQMNNQAINH